MVISTGPDDEVKDPFPEGRGYSRGGLRSICQEYGIAWAGLTSTQMVQALNAHPDPEQENGRKNTVATKLNLDRTFAFGGKHYGPGITVVEDQDAADAITAKIKALQEEEGGLKAGSASSPVVSSGATPGEVQARIDALAAKEADLDAQKAENERIKADLEARLAAMNEAQAETETGLDSAARERLAVAGYDTPESLAQASDEDLLKVTGIGPATVAKIRQVAAG